LPLHGPEKEFKDCPAVASICDKGEDDGVRKSSEEFLNFYQTAQRHISGYISPPEVMNYVGILFIMPYYV
jgi:hypothetical protein